MRKKPPLLTYDEVLAKWPDWTVGDASFCCNEATLDLTLASKKRSYLRVGYLLKFIQDNGLTRRVICADAPKVPDDQVIYLRDITEDGYALVRAARNTWDSYLERENADPSNLSLLEKELAKIRASAGKTEQAKSTEPKKKTTPRPLSGKRAVKDLVAASKPIEFVKYDDASWHYEGKFPVDLPNEAGATHTGMFVAWAVLSGLASEDHIKAFPGELSQLKSRNLSPGAYFIRTCDGKFTSDELSREGNVFAHAYFDLQAEKYLQDYEGLLAAGLPSTYHVPDTWDSFDKLKPILDQRFSEWVRDGRRETL